MRWNHRPPAAFTPVDLDTEWDRLVSLDDKDLAIERALLSAQIGTLTPQPPTIDVAAVTVASLAVSVAVITSSGLNWGSKFATIGICLGLTILALSTHAHLANSDARAFRAELHARLSLADAALSVRGTGVKTHGPGAQAVVASSHPTRWWCHRRRSRHRKS